MPLAFSTCWNSSRHTRGDEMLNEIFALGFDRVELGHGIRQSLWEGIEQFLADHPMTVTSLHNFCPLPDRDPGFGAGLLPVYFCQRGRTRPRPALHPADH